MNVAMALASNLSINNSAAGPDVDAPMARPSTCLPVHEHRTIDHKTATRSASIQEEAEEKENGEEEQGLRRSRRIQGKKKRDFKAEDKGTNQQLTEGGTEFSAHVASDVHQKEDLEFSVLCKDDNWFSRGVKEAVAIRKIKPSLNQDEGRFHLSPIYDKFIRTSLVLKTPSQGAKEATEESS